MKFLNKEVIKYKRLLRQERRKLVKKAKKFKPWDYVFFIEMVDQMISFFLRYYAEGNCCLQSEESANEILAQLLEVKDLLSNITEKNYSEEAEKLFENQEYKEKFKSEYHLCEYLIKEDVEKCFSLIGKNIRYWWD